MRARTLRRAAERAALKAARKAGLQLSAPQQTAAPAAPPNPSLVTAPPQSSEPQAAFLHPGSPFPLLAEITPNRLAANRENAQKSTGPVTDEGKAVSSQNRLTHGLARHNGRFALLPTENPDDYADLLNGYLAEHNPTTPTEKDLVHNMAESRWLANRAQNLQATCFDPATGLATNEKSLSLYIRYESTYNRAYKAAFKQLQSLRADRRKAELGFEAQKRQQAAETRAQEKHQMKKDAHYWDILKKDAETCHELGRNLMQKLDGMKLSPDFPQRLDAEIAKHTMKQAA
jgi:hypothetical protein